MSHLAIESCGIRGCCDEAVVTYQRRSGVTRRCLRHLRPRRNASPTTAAMKRT
jgi:hypothetical protein